MSGDPLTRFQLDGLGCDVPGCTAVHPPGPTGPRFLHARCHLKAGLAVCYEAGVLTITCAKCGSGVARIAVAGS